MTEPLYRIALLDDRSDQRDTVIRGLSPLLPDDWECIECPLLKGPDDYSIWLVNNRVLVLLLDQLLDEQAPASGKPVDYRGHDVMRAVRKSLKDFPIVVVTRATEDHDLRDNLGVADDIVNRTTLLQYASSYLMRIMRQGRKWYEENQNDLKRLSELSRKAAVGEADENDINEIRLLQTKLDVPEQPLKRDVLISALEREVDKLAQLNVKVQNYIKDKAPSRRAKKPSRRSKRKK